MEFKPNVIKLSAWGNSETVKRGQKSAGRRLSRSKVTCMNCYQRMSAQEFRAHKRKVCPGAKGEME